MKSSKFKEAQKAFILKQGEQGTPVAEAVWKLDAGDRGMADFSGLTMLTGQMHSD